MPAIGASTTGTSTVSDPRVSEVGSEDMGPLSGGIARRPKSSGRGRCGRAARVRRLVTNRRFQAPARAVCDQTTPCPGWEGLEAWRWRESHLNQPWAWRRCRGRVGSPQIGLDTPVAASSLGRGATRPGACALGLASSTEARSLLLFLLRRLRRDVLLDVAGPVDRVEGLLGAEADRLEAAVVGRQVDEAHVLLGARPELGRQRRARAGLEGARERRRLQQQVVLV